MSPQITDGPVFVIVDPAITANEVAVARPTVAVAAFADWVPNIATVAIATRPTVTTLGPDRDRR
jgi:hypothetical protein